MKPTKEQIEQIAFELFNSDYGLQMIKDDWEYRPQRFRDYYRNLARVAIIEWEKIRGEDK